MTENIERNDLTAQEGEPGYVNLDTTQAAESSRYAVVRDGVVENVIIASKGFEVEGATLVQTDDAQKGQLWDGERFTDAPPPKITRDQVNAERDRRFGLGFYFGGVLYQSDRDSRENVAGAGTMALGAMMAGKQPGDYRWARPDRDFSWTAADNSQVLMDAQTVFAFAASLGVRKEAFIKAAQAIKAMDLIPQDYASNDAYWPTLAP